MYDSYFPYQDDSLIGAPIVCKTGIANIYVNYPSYGKGYQFNGKNIRAGYGTGNYGMYNGRYTVQVLLEFSEYAYGWVYMDEFSASVASKSYSRESVQSLINGIIENNKNIVFNNLVCARLITVLESKGKTVPNNIKAGIKELQQNVQFRDERLKQNEWLTGRQTGKPLGASDYEGDLNKLMNANIGAVFTISLTTLIVVSVIATLLITTLLYMAFTQSGKAALSDYKASEKYLNTLAGMDKDSREIVENEMSKALNYGYKIGSKSLLKNLGLLAAGMGILLVAKPVKELLTDE